jgi:hypothetical protein
MTNETHPANPTGHGDFERRDIGIAPVLYFLGGLALFGLIIHLVVAGFYDGLEKRTEAQQPPISPLITSAPKDTRHLHADYRDYLKQNFPSPQLEIDERNQLDKIRLDEAQELSAYSWLDENSGTVRIPIERAMDLIAERGLPVRGQVTTNTAQAPSTAPGTSMKGKKQ